MRVLALDLSKSATGFALDRDGAGAPLTGIYRLVAGGNDRGHAFWKFGVWLNSMLKQNAVEMVAYEAPIVGGAPTGKHEALLLIGLAAITEQVAASRGIRSVDAAVQTVRKYFVGSGRPDNPKQVVLARCKQLRWDVDGSTDRADAAALWAWAKANHTKGWQLETGPIFVGA